MEDRKTKKEEQNDTEKYLFIKKNALSISVLLSCVLTICNIGVVVFKLLFQKDISFIDLLTTDTITLIGVAISVWIGITIFNSVDNTRIKAIEDSIKTAEETRIKLEEKNKILLDQIEILQKQHLETNRRLFLTEGIKNGDLFVEYISSQIETNSHQEYFILYSIENTFTDIKSVHNSFYLTLEQKRKKYNDILELIEESINAFINSDNGNKRILSYLEYRQGDFYFYTGYLYGAAEEYEEQFHSFNMAKRLYEKVFKDSCLMNAENIILTQNKQLSVYLYNMLGECNSKQVEAYYRMEESDRKEYKIDDVETDAQKYCGLAVSTMEKYKKINEVLLTETYYRNYGWAIMRSSCCDTLNDLSEIKKAKGLFEKAYKLNKENYKIFNALISTNLILICKTIDFQIYSSLKYLKPLPSNTSLSDQIVEEEYCQELHKQNSGLYKIAKNKFAEQGDIFLYEVWELLLLIHTNLKFGEENLSMQDLRDTIKYNIEYVSQFTAYNKRLFDSTIALSMLILADSFIL